MSIITHLTLDDFTLITCLMHPEHIGQLHLKFIKESGKWNCFKHNCPLCSALHLSSCQKVIIDVCGRDCVPPLLAPLSHLSQDIHAVL